MRTLKLVLTEDNGEVNGCNMPITRSATKEITDAEIREAMYSGNFDLIREIKKLSDKLRLLNSL